MKKVLAMLLTLVVGMTWFTGCTPDPERHAHTWSDWTETKAATCTEAGELYRECTGCGYKQTTYTAYGHKWGDWTTVTEQTCESKGEKKRVCSVCSAEEKQELPALGDHDYVMTVREGDCQTETIYTYTCSKCGDKYTETGNKVPDRHFGVAFGCGLHCSLCGVAGEENHAAMTCGIENHYLCDGLNHTECAIPVASNMNFTAIEGGAAYRLDRYTEANADTAIFVPAFYNGKPVVEIADSVFDGDSVPNGAAVAEWLNNITYLYIPDTVKTIGNYFVYGMKSVESVRLPKAVESWGRNTFYAVPALKALNVPQGVTELYGNVGNESAILPSALETVTLPAGFTGVSALKNVLKGNVATVNYQGTEAQWNELMKNADASVQAVAAKAEKNFNYDYQALYNAESQDMQLRLVGFSFIAYGEGYAITGYPGIAKETLTIPAEILGKPVLALASSALDATNAVDSNVESLKAVKNIVFEADIVSVGDYNFFSMPNLEKVILPESVTSVGVQCFYDCASLTEVSIPAGATMNLAKAPFANCPNLVKLALPDTLYGTADSGAFSGSNANLKITVGVNSNVWYLFTRAAKANWEKAGITYNNGKAIEQDGNGVEYLLSEDGSYYTLAGFYDTAKHEGAAVAGYTIPDTFNNKPIKAIGDAVFNSDAYENAEIANWIRNGLGAVVVTSTTGTNVEYLGNYNFVGMNAITLYRLPVEIKNERLIGCFNNINTCIGMNTITSGIRIPRGVKVMEDCFNWTGSAWFNSALNPFIYLPASLERFEGSCFGGSAIAFFVVMDCADGESVSKFDAIIDNSPSLPVAVSTFLKTLSHPVGGGFPFVMGDGGIWLTAFNIPGNTYAGVSANF